MEEQATRTNWSLIIEHLAKHTTQKLIHLQVIAADHVRARVWIQLMLPIRDKHAQIGIEAYFSDQMQKLLRQACAVPHFALAVLTNELYTQHLLQVTVTPVWMCQNKYETN